MNTAPFTAPKLLANAFNCPYAECRAYSNQIWFQASVYQGGWAQVEGLDISFCSCCKKPSFWYNEKMIHPRTRSAPPPNLDLPSDIMRDYEEAAAIAIISPRGAAALLRLCIQKICAFLGEKGSNINEDIGSLVSKGLPTEIKQALDVVRVAGNNSVHPGQIDMADEQETVGALFLLVNIIAERLISMPKKVLSLHDSLPESIQAAIGKRDAKSLGALPPARKN